MVDQALATNKEAQASALRLRSRPRRLRLSPAIRDLVRETSLDPADFIYPLFIRHGADLQLPIESMPGQYQWTLDRLPAEIRSDCRTGHTRGDTLWHPGA